MRDELEPFVAGSRSAGSPVARIEEIFGPVSSGALNPVDNADGCLGQRTSVRVWFEAGIAGFARRDRSVEMGPRVRQAERSDVPEIVPLFDAYRVFYEQPSDLAAAEAFLDARFESGDSTILLACPDGEAPVGFTQLSASYSSVLMRRIFVLNDLFVAPAGRRLGAGRALLEAAHEFSREAGAARISLRTAVTNAPAQQLYRAMGYERDELFYAFNLTL